MIRARKSAGKQPRFRHLVIEQLSARHMLSGNGLPGDANADGVVNGLDVALVSGNWLQTGPQPLAGDVNADGVVNGLDIALVSSNWLDKAGPLAIAAPGSESAGANGAVAVDGIALSDPYLPTSDNVTLTLTVSNGTLGLSTSIAGGVTSDQVTNNGTAALTVTAPLAAINSTLADSTGLTYTRTNGSSGSDALALSASDPLGNSDSASVSITSGGPLVITTPSGTQTVATGGTLAVSGVSLADPPLPNSEDVTITLAVTDGTVAISTTVNGGVSSDQITDNGTASVTVAAPLAAINATFADSNGLTYAPATGFRGSDTLALSASDPLGNSDSASVSVVVGGLTPADVSGTQLWLDPSDLSTLKLRDVVGLSASGQGELSRPGSANDPADFHNTDGAGDTQMSVTFWVYFNSIVPDAGILGDSTGATSGSWALTYSSGGNHLRFWDFNGSNGAISDVIDSTSTAFQPGEWYYVALTFDGSQVAASRLHVWIGSVDTTDNGEQLVPQALSSNPTQTDFYAGGASNPFWIGYSGINSYANMRMSDLAAWDRPLSSAEITTLWNGGEGVPVGDLGSDGLSDYAFAYPLSEASGIRNDIGPNGLNLTPSGAVAQVQEVESWTDKSQYHLVYQAGDGNADAQGPIHLYRSREMLYSPNYFGPGKPAVVQENDNQSLYVSFPENSWNRADTGYMFTKTQWSATNEDEYFGLVLGNDTLNSDAGGVDQGDRYWLNLLIDPTSMQSANFYGDALRFSNGSDNQHAGAVWDVNLSNGAYAPFPQNVYVSGKPNPAPVYSEMSFTGSTPGQGTTQGGWRININGNDQSLYVNTYAPTGGWTNLVSDIDYSSLGSIDRTQDDLAQPYTRLGKNVVTAYGVQVMVAGTMADSQEGALRSWFEGQ